MKLYFSVILLFLIGSVSLGLCLPLVRQRERSSCVTELSPYAHDAHVDAHVDAHARVKRGEDGCANTCRYHGECVNKVCECYEQYYEGPDCLQEKNYCEPNPCKNEGKCIPIWGHFFCKCNNNYLPENEVVKVPFFTSGIYCEKKIPYEEAGDLDRLRYKVEVLFDVPAEVGKTNGFLIIIKERDHLGVGKPGVFRGTVSNGVGFTFTFTHKQLVRYDAVTNIILGLESPVKDRWSTDTEAAVLVAHNVYSVKDADLTITVDLYNHEELQFAGKYSLKTTANPALCVPNVVLQDCGAAKDTAPAWTRNLEYTIRSKAEPGCPEVPDEQRKFKTTWSLYKITEEKPYPILVSMGGGNSVVLTPAQTCCSPELLLQPFKVDYGLYFVMARVDETVSGIAKTSGANGATCWFEMSRQPAEATIRGGAKRKLWRGGAIQLDGSGSNDPNEPPDRQELIYRWSCVRPDAAADTVCRGHDHEVDNKTVCTIAANALKAGLYSFQLTVKASSTMSKKEFDGVANQEIDVDDSDFPTELQIECAKNCPPLETSNPSEVIVLEAVCTKNCKGADAAHFYQWTLEGGKTINWAVDTEFGNRAKTLAILENALADGEKYTFSLAGGTQTGDVQATYTITTSKKPTVGSCTVEPPTGISMETIFNVSCTGFGSATNHSANLVYYFYQSNNLNQSGLGVLISYGNIPVKDDLKLTAGSKITVKVKDELGMFVTVDVPVTVTAPSALTIEHITDLIHGKGNLTSLKMMIEGGDTSSAVRAVTSLTDALGQLDAGTENITDREMHLFKAKTKASFLEVLNEVPLHSSQAVVQVGSCLQKVVQTDSNSTDHRSAEKGSDVMIRVAQKLLQHTTDNLDNQRLNTAELKQVVVHVMETIDTIMSEDAKKIELDPQYSEDPQEAEYDHYDYLDDEFVERTGDFNYASVNMFNTINLLAQAVSNRQHETLKASHLKANDIAMWVKRDKPTNLAGKYLGGFEGDNSTLGVFFSPSLAEALERESPLINLQIAMMKKNPLWFKDKGHEMNSMVTMIHMEREYVKSTNVRGVPVTNKLPEPVDIYLGVPEQPTEPVKGRVTVNASATRDDLEYMISVHRIEMYNGSVVYLDFEPTEAKLDVVVIQGTRPTIDDFDKAVTIPREGDDVADVDRRRLLAGERAVDDVWFYVGLLPHGVASAAPHVAKSETSYAFSVYKARCTYWHAELNKWDTDSCELGANYTLTRLHCRCVHLSTFSGSIIVAPNKVDPFNDLGLFLTFVDNPIVVSLVVTILLLYLLLLILLRICDRRDLKQRGVTILEDNRPGDQYPYLLTVYTGRKGGAGTSSNIGITLIGASLKGRPHLLKDPNRKILYRNSDCWFLLLTHECLGELKYINLWSDNSGHSPAWYCLRIVVTDLEMGREWVFLVDRWLSVSHGDGTVSCVAPVATERQLSSWKYLFTDHANLGFREDHMWLSIALRHPRSNFTRCQRLSVAVTVLLLAMLANLMFYGIPRNEPADHFDVGSFSISTREFIIPIEAALVTVPISVLIVILFRKTIPKDEELNRKPKENKKTPQPEGDVASTSEKPQEDVKPTKKVKWKWRKKRTMTKDKIPEENEELPIEPKIVKQWVYQLHAAPRMSEDASTAGAGERRRTFTSAQPMEDPTRRRSQVARGVLNVLLMDPLAPAVAGQSDKTSTDERNAAAGDAESPKKKKKKLCSPCCGKKSSNEEADDKSKDKEHLGGPAYWFPSWFIYVAWTVCILTMLIAAFFVSLYGLSFGYNKSLLWITTIGIFFVQSIFIIQPIKVIVIAIILALCFKKKPKTYSYECTPSTAIESTKNKYLTYDQRLRMQQSKSMYRPLPPSEVRRIRQRELLEVQFGEMLGDLGMYMVYIVSLYWVVLASRDSFAYLSTQNMVNMVVLGTYNSGPEWHGVQSMPDLIEYLNETLLPAIHAEEYYNGDFVDRSGWMADHNIHLLGVARLRQERIRENRTCKVVPGFNRSFSKCYGEYNSDTKETGDFSLGWKPVTSRYQDLDKKATDPWLYKSTFEALGQPFVGEFANYPGGGYIADLGRTRFNSRLVLKFLVTRNWFDIYTRAVFIEFTSFNANSNLFNVVVLTAEMGASGAWYTWANIQTVKLLAIHEQLGVVSLLVLVVCLVVLILHFWRQISKAHSFKQYFSNLWNIMDISIILIVTTCVGFYYARSKYVYSLMKRLEMADGNEYVSFLLAAYWDVLLTYLIAVLVATSTARLWKLLHFGRNFRHFEYTLARASEAVMCLVLILVLILATFVTVIMLLIGGISAQFRNVSNSISTLLSLALGFADWEADVEAFWQFRIGPFFFFAYCLVSVIYMLNMFITVIVISYETSQLVDTEVATQRYGPFDYLIDQLRYYSSLCRRRPKSGQQRLRGGADAPQPPASRRRVRATPKREELRNINAFLVPKDRLDAMKLLTLDAIKHGNNENAGGDAKLERKPSSERLEAMKAIAVDRAKEDGDVERETEAFYKGRDGKVHLVIPESTLKEMEVIVNDMPDPYEKENEDIDDIPTEDDDDGNLLPAFREVSDMEMLKIKLDALARLLDELSSEDETRDETPEPELESGIGTVESSMSRGRGDATKEPDVAGETESLQKPAEKNAQETDGEREKTPPSDIETKGIVHFDGYSDTEKEKSADDSSKKRLTPSDIETKGIVHFDGYSDTEKEKSADDSSKKRLTPSDKETKGIVHFDGNPESEKEKSADHSSKKMQTSSDKKIKPRFCGLAGKRKSANDTKKQRKTADRATEPLQKIKYAECDYVPPRLRDKSEYIGKHVDDTPVQTSSGRDQQPVPQTSQITDERSKGSPTEELKADRRTCGYFPPPLREDEAKYHIICKPAEGTPVQTRSERDNQPITQTSPRTNERSKRAPSYELKDNACTGRKPYYPDGEHEPRKKGTTPQYVRPTRSTREGKNKTPSPDCKTSPARATGEEEELIRTHTYGTGEYSGGKDKNRIKTKDKEVSSEYEEDTKSGRQHIKWREGVILVSDDDEDGNNSDVCHDRGSDINDSGSDDGVADECSRSANEDELMGCKSGLKTSSFKQDRDENKLKRSYSESSVDKDGDESDYIDDYDSEIDESSELSSGEEMRDCRCKMAIKATETEKKDENGGSQYRPSNSSVPTTDSNDDDDSYSDGDIDGSDADVDEPSELLNVEELKECKCEMKTNVPSGAQKKDENVGPQIRPSNSSVSKTGSKKEQTDDESRNERNEGDNCHSDYDSDDDSDDDVGESSQLSSVLEIKGGKCIIRLNATVAEIKYINSGPQNRPSNISIPTTDSDDEDEDDTSDDGSDVDESSELSSGEEMKECKCGMKANATETEKKMYENRGPQNQLSNSSVPNTDSKHGQKYGEFKNEGKEQGSGSSDDGDDEDEDTNGDEDDTENETGAERTEDDGYEGPSGSTSGAGGQINRRRLQM